MKEVEDFEARRGKCAGKTPVSELAVVMGGKAASDFKGAHDALAAPCWRLRPNRLTQ